MNESNILTDRFGRNHNYLRISLTPHCNLRCSYCMPNEDYDAPPASQLMQTSEILEIAKVFVGFGVNKIRLTGGEPLVRSDAADVIRQLADLKVQLAITTNGTRLHHFQSLFSDIGLHSINISLDTLSPQKFEMITRRNQFQQVWDNIVQMLENGFHVKLNVVVMKGINDGEILDFVALTHQYPLHIRFIEFMPFEGNKWVGEKVFGWQQILDVVSSKFDYYSLKPMQNDTAKSYQVFNAPGTFSVISTMTAPFCSTCNRMRLTADGKMKNCLFSQTEMDLLSALRQGKNIESLIRQSIAEKAERTGGQFTGIPNQESLETIKNRSMIAIGG